MTLAEALTDTIRQRGMTGTEAANIMGTSQVNVSRWTRGAIPGPAHYAALRTFLEVSDDDLGRLIHASRAATSSSRLERRIDDLETEMREIRERLADLVRAQEARSGDGIPPSRRRPAQGGR